jgi:hypothetical protein
MGGINQKRPTAIECTMNHAKTSFSREIFAGAITSVVKFLAPLRRTVPSRSAVPLQCTRVPHTGCPSLYLPCSWLHARYSWDTQKAHTCMKIALYLWIPRARLQCNWYTEGAVQDVTRCSYYVPGCFATNLTVPMNRSTCDGQAASTHCRTCCCDRNVLTLRS